MTDARNKEYTGDLDDGTFSIVLSHRTGPFISESDPPKPCVVHVVALDSVKPGFIAGSDIHKVVTLFSWTYDCLPPSTINFRDTMMAVGKNSGALRTPSEIFNKRDTKLPEAIRKRMEDGYTLVRYRVQTGEETVALMRGPFTPFDLTGGKGKWFKVKSNSGEDLQIIDTPLGMIDISYCAAWQIGKALAIADQAFSAALLRIRGYVHNASSEARKQVAITQHYEDSRSKELIDRLSKTFDTLTGLGWKVEADTKRYSRLPLVQSRYQDIASIPIDRYKDIKRLGERLGGLTSAIGEQSSHFTELKDPQSSDWKLVLNWLMDKIYLEGIPPYYLISDPTWLPSESIRFFYVDEKWLSALVDGALSVCNHLDKDDATREAIKDELQHYITSDLHPDYKYPPQLPRYGCYMRSVAVSALPDFILRAPLPPGDKRAEVLRQENVGKNVLFCLFDRSPTGEGDEKLTEVQFTQPPHQQCFTFCNESLTEDKLDVEIRKVYSVAGHKMGIFDPKRYTRPHDATKCDVYDWSSRTIRLDGFAELIVNTLKGDSDKDLYKGPANAALIGIQLNDPVYQLTFTTDSTSSPTPETFSLPAGRVSRKRADDENLLPPGTNLDLPASSRGSLVELSEPALPSVSLSTSEIASVDDKQSMFEPWCLTAGSYDYDNRNYLEYHEEGTDVVFSLIRKDKLEEPEDLPDGALGDYIIRVKLTIPLELFTKAPGVHDARMVRNIRLLPVIQNKDKNVIIELIPKVQDGFTLLEHNENLSFMIVGAHLKLGAKEVAIQVTESYKKYGDVSSELQVEEVEKV
jgi:hypothetical protein